MKEEFNLSKKKLWANMVSDSNAINKIEIYCEEDVKEFIKRLKERAQLDNCPACKSKMICPKCKVSMNDEHYWVRLNDILGLAGKKLK